MRIKLESLTNRQLLKLSETAGIGLSLEEIHRVRKYFASIGRDPTDVELQSIGQAWSEHCCYKSSKPILRKFILGIDKSEVLARDDAGVVKFTKDYAYVLRMESHNHPSAIEPYGGAATGIGGIVRDVLCMGAQPIALIDPLFFGPLEAKKIPKNVRHPKYLFSGVVAGIRDYGNRIGIPTVAGSVYFHPGYISNCVVNVGCVGVVNVDKIRRSIAKKNDLLLLIGGKTGRDGIHGVTFASKELSKSAEEERSAVQLGNPILKEPLIHACIEVSERNLISGMKDLGGGGLSCVVGEMALAGDVGAEVYLDKVPCKEKRMQPWEVWVSESQERMMLSLQEKKLDEVLGVFASWDLEATVIGKVIPEKRVKVFWGERKVLDLPTTFLTKAPEYCRRMELRKREIAERIPNEPGDYEGLLLRVVAEPNIASKSWVIRQYDHEVRGNTVLKPLQGKIESSTHGDASMIKPLENSWHGLAITTASAPGFATINPYRAGKSIIDEVCRNLVSVGAKPDSLTDCLNFGNPEKPDRLGAFYEVLRGMGEVAAYLNLPFPSGNVSFYNETEKGPIPPTPVVLGVGVVRDVRKCITTDVKHEQSLIYLIGETRKELGGSSYYRLVEASSPVVPDTDPEMLKKSIYSMLSAITSGHVVSCHDISHGGLAVATAEMCIGGAMGMQMDLSTLGDLRTDFKLFSESNTRWLVEVKKGKESEFESLMKGVKLCKIGAVGGKCLVIRDRGKEVVNLPVSEIGDAWRKPLWKLMG